MKAEDVAEFLQRRGGLVGGAYPSRALAVFNLIAERNALLDERQRFEARLFDMAETGDKARAERDALQRTFDMMWAAQSRAIAAWQERHDKPMTWPGHERLVDWLLEDRERLRAALQGLLRHPGIADMDPEDKDPEDHAAERAARSALEGTYDRNRRNRGRA